MGICCMAQETQAGARYQHRKGWDGEGAGRAVQKGRDIYTYGLFILRFDRKQQNSVKQLSFNKNFFNKNFLKMRWSEASISEFQI